MRFIRMRADISPQYYPIVMNCVNRDEEDRLEIKSNRGERLEENGPLQKKSKLDVKNTCTNESIPQNIQNCATYDAKKNTEPDDAESTSIKKESQKGARIKDCTEKDVLSGRGGRTNTHPGNQYYRELIVSRCTAYEEATKIMKPEISEQIVRTIYLRGGRFLRRGSDGWYCDIGWTTAKEKTSQALRHKSLDIRNLLDPNRPKRNGRRKQKKKKEEINDDDGNKPISQKKSTEPTMAAREPAARSNLEEVDSSIASRIREGQTGSGGHNTTVGAQTAYQRYIESLDLYLAQRDQSLRHNECVIPQHHSALNRFDMLRLYQRNAIPQTSLLPNPTFRSTQFLSPPSAISQRIDYNMMNRPPSHRLDSREYNVTDEMIEQILQLYRGRNRGRPPLPEN